MLQELSFRFCIPSVSEAGGLHANPRWVSIKM